MGRPAKLLVNARETITAHTCFLLLGRRLPPARFLNPRLSHVQEGVIEVPLSGFKLLDNSRQEVQIVNGIFPHGL